MLDKLKECWDVAIQHSGGFQDTGCTGNNRFTWWILPIGKSNNNSERENKTVRATQHAIRHGYIPQRIVKRAIKCNGHASIYSETHIRSTQRNSTLFTRFTILRTRRGRTHTPPLHVVQTESMWTRYTRATLWVCGLRMRFAHYPYCVVWRHCILRGWTTQSR